MFLFQTNTYMTKPTESIYSYEQAFLRLHTELKHQDVSALKDFYKAVSGLYSQLPSDKSSLNDKESAKQMAFCSVALAWLNDAFEKAGVKDYSLEIKKNLDTLNILTSSTLSDASRHYKHFFGAVSHLVIELGDGTQAFLFNQKGVDTLVKMLDDAYSNGRTTLAIVFPTKELADAFASQVLPYLPFAAIQNARVRDGAMYTSFNLAGKYVAVFSCEYDEKNQPDAYVKNITSTTYTEPEEVKYDVKKTKIKKTEELPPGIKQADIDRLLPGIKDKPVLESIRKGKATIEEIAGLYYALQHQGRNAESKELVQATVRKVLELLALRYGYDVKNNIDSFVKTEDGKEFMRKISGKMGAIIGSASIEVFYDGTNYADYRKALVKNWNEAAGQRADMGLEAFNELLMAAGLPTVDTKTQMKLYLYQDIGDGLKSQLLTDAKVPSAMKDWLNNTYKYGDGQRNFTDMVNFLADQNNDKTGEVYQKLLACSNVSQDSEGNTVYSMKPGYEGQMNHYFSRMPSDRTLKGKGDKQGLRNESDPENILVNAIDEGFTTQGSSRSVSMSVSFNGELGIIQGDATEKKYKPGETISIKIDAPYKVEGDEVNFMKNMDENGVSFHGKINVEIYDASGKKLDYPVKIAKKSDGYYVEFTPDQKDLKVESSESTSKKKTKNKYGDETTKKTTTTTEKKFSDFTVVAYSVTKDSKLNSGLSGQTVKVEDSKTVITEKKKTDKKKKTAEDIDRLNYPVKVVMPTGSADLKIGSFQWQNFGGRSLLDSLVNTINEAGKLREKGDVTGALAKFATLMSVYETIAANPQYLAAWQGAIVGGDVQGFFQKLAAGQLDEAKKMIINEGNLIAIALGQMVLSLADSESALAYLQYYSTTRTATTKIDLMNNDKGIIRVYASINTRNGEVSFHNTPLSQDEMAVGNVTVMGFSVPLEAFVAFGYSHGYLKNYIAGQEISNETINALNASVGFQRNLWQFTDTFLRVKGEVQAQLIWVGKDRTWTITPSATLTTADYIKKVVKPFVTIRGKITERSLQDMGNFYFNPEVGAKVRPFGDSDMGLFFKKLEVNASVGGVIQSGSKPFATFTMGMFFPISGESGEEVETRRTFR